VAGGAHGVEEQLVEPELAHDLGVERGSEKGPLPHRDDATVVVPARAFASLIW